MSKHWINVYDTTNGEWSEGQPDYVDKSAFVLFADAGDA